VEKKELLFTEKARETPGRRSAGIQKGSDGEKRNRRQLELKRNIR